MPRTVRLGVALLLGALAPAAVLAPVAAAHPLAPSLLELREEAAGSVRVRFRTPLAQRPGAPVVPELPCRMRETPVVATDATSATFTWSADCGARGLRGRELRMRGLRESGTDALLRVQLADGELVRSVLRAGDARFVVPLRASHAGVVRDYLALGLSHLLAGMDHLLFVLGLVLLLQGWRRLVPAVTGFTLGHSVTLSLATLGGASAPTAGVEIGIAASLFWLALRLVEASGGQAPPAQAWRMAALLGLLHGLGFARALAEAGLPAGEVPLALFAFNLGIELGQLGVVAVLLALRALLEPLGARSPRWLARAPAYAIGTLAAALVFERAAAGLF
jgi:hypothetical protein